MINMNITLNVEISNKDVKNFPELVKEIYGIAMSIGRELLKQALEQLDADLLAERDTQRYRCKGLRKTCIKTLLGTVEYRRRVYVDAAASECKRCVHLLDEALGIDKIGLVSSEVCQIAATAVTETTYRDAANLITDLTGQPMTHQGVWNIIQKLGQAQTALVHRHTELAENHSGTGALSSKILYEEDDGIWLRLQGKSRKEYGSSKEMKVGIAYDGVLWENTKSGKRRTLDNKVAYASFEKADEFKKNKEGLVASRYDVEDIKLRVHNGDGAAWIRRKNSEDCIDVLDAFHINKKITECVRDSKFAALLKKHLYNKDTDLMLTCLEAQINSVTDPAMADKLRELNRYLTENRDSLLGYYDRGIEIPETRAPGVIHHARLGSMESNVFTLIGNRMKGRRACWSEAGANNLAILLCQKHTIGFEDLFAELPALPVPDVKEPEYVDTLPVFGASKVPEREGKGYELNHHLMISGTTGWLNGFLREMSKSNNL